MRNALEASTNAAAVRLHTNCLYLDPIVVPLGVAAQELGRAVDGVHDDIDVTVVVEISEGTASCGDRLVDPRPGLQRYVFEPPITEILVEELALRVSRLGLQLLDLGIDVPVADQD